MIRYSIAIANAAAHLFSVQLNFQHKVSETNTSELVTLSLPVWIPGSYMVREFARNIVEIHATVNGHEAALIKQDKNSWCLPVVGDSTVQLEYTVYAWDFSVRSAHLDQQHGFFNNTSLCLRVHGREHEPCRFELVAPADSLGLLPNAKQWKVATTLSPVKRDRAGFGEYQAENYDELIDHPIELGTFQEIAFEVLGIPHRAVFTGTTDVDLQRIASDLKAICAEQIRFFEPTSHEAPFKEYLFMTHVSSDGFGGLEHRSSTALHCARNDLPFVGMGASSTGYRQFLGLCSHEYFHSWNVKRIKPAAFTPYNLHQENYTSLLWIFEGFTSYYDDLLLLRAGCISLDEYLNLLSITITRVASEPGRLKQSIADSSFDSWIKYYRQDENSPNSLISYYTKGSLVALCLDLTIRKQTRGQRSLDDVMRLLWADFGKTGRGLGENEFAKVVAQATGVRLDREIKRWAYSPGELPVQDLLHQAGIEWHAKTDNAPDLGLKIVQRGADLVVSHAYADRPGQLAGVSAHDILIAVDGLRATESHFKNWLTRKKSGDTIKLSVFRRDELLQFTLRLGKPRISALQLKKHLP